METKGLIKGNNFDEVMTKIGYGKYQFIVFLVSGFTSFTQGSELVILCVFQKYLSEVHDFSFLLISFLATLIFAWQTLGIVISGYYSDKLGRLFMLKIGYLIILISGVICALIPNFIAFIILRSITNFGIGICLPIGTTYTLENSPSRNRGFLAISFEGFYLIGQGLVLILVYFCMNNSDGSNWILVFGLTPLLGVFALLAMFTLLYESPWFLLRTGKNGQGLIVTESISMVNTGKGLTDKEISIIRKIEPMFDNKNILEVVINPEYRPRTFKLMVVMAANLVGFSGAFYLLPGLIDSDNFYLGFLLCIICIIPVWILSFILIERIGWGRKYVLLLNFLIIVVLCILGCTLATNEIGMIIVLGGICGLASVSNIVLVPFILEQYETEIRSSSYTLINIIARVQMLYIPAVFVLISFKPMYPIVFYAMTYSIAAACIFSIKQDTAGRELDYNYN